MYILQAYHYAIRNFLTKITPAAVIGFPETPTSVAASADQQIRQFPDSRLEKTIVKSFDISTDKIDSANLCKEYIINGKKCTTLIKRFKSDH